MEEPSSAELLEPSSALVVETDSGLICANSNGYLSWWMQCYGKLPSPTSFSAFYRQRLENTYSKILRSTPSIKIDTPFVYLSTVYTGWNIGHELSTLFHALAAYLSVKASPAFDTGLRSDLCIGTSLANLDKSSNSRDLLYSLISSTKVIDLPPGRLCYCPKIITPPTSYLHLYSSTVFHIVDLFVSLVQTNPVINHDVMIKTQGADRFAICKREQNRFERPAGIMPLWVENRLKDIGFFIIDPEQLTLLEIIYIISKSAKYLLMGSGAVQYAHKVFVSPDVRVRLLFDHENCPPRHPGQDLHTGIPELEWTSHDHWNAALAKIKSEVI